MTYLLTPMNCPLTFLLPHQAPGHPSWVPQTSLMYFPSLSFVNVLFIIYNSQKAVFQLTRPFKSPLMKIGGSNLQQPMLKLVVPIQSPHLHPIGQNSALACSNSHLLFNLYYNLDGYISLSRTRWLCTAFGPSGFPRDVSGWGWARVVFYLCPMNTAIKPYCYWHLTT